MTFDTSATTGFRQRLEKVANTTGPCSIHTKPTPMGVEIIKRAKAGYVHPSTPEAPRTNRGRP
jgi:hypothetical protein